MINFCGDKTAGEKSTQSFSNKVNNKVQQNDYIIVEVLQLIALHEQFSSNRNSKYCALSL